MIIIMDCYKIIYDYYYTLLHDHPANSCNFGYMYFVYIISLSHVLWQVHNIYLVDMVVRIINH